MKILLITTVLLSGIIACSSKRITRSSDFRNESDYLFKNPCWGIANLEKLYLKWNWIKLKKNFKQIKGPFYLEFKIVRYNQFKDVIFEHLIYRTRKAMVPLDKKYLLYSPFYTKDIYVKNLKKMIMLDQAYFQTIELNDYNLSELEEKNELGSLYDNSDKGYRESFIIANKANGKCRSSYLRKSPHYIEVSLYDQNKGKVISEGLPLKNIQRAPPYFNKWELPKLGHQLKGELYPVTIGISMVLEKFTR